MRTINLPEFRDELANANLGVFQTTSSTDEMWSTWHTKFMSVLDRHGPLKSASRKASSYPPWSERELYQFKCRKNMLHRQLRQDKDSTYLHFAFRLPWTNGYPLQTLTAHSTLDQLLAFAQEELKLKEQEKKDQALRTKVTWRKWRPTSSCALTRILGK